MLIKEVVDDEVPHRSTGINVLEDLLKNQPALFLRIVKTLAERLKQTTQDYWYLTELSLTESDKYF